MKREKTNNLLGKYYKGETSLEEEKRLKTQNLPGEMNPAEKDVFEYFQKESSIPEDLEKTIFKHLFEKQKSRETVKIRLYRLFSAAAVILILLTVYTSFRIKNAKMENEFFVMEQALFQISQSIQPEEQEEMLVLWVDNDVEIIIN
jgi:hypothetical protein